MRCLVFSHLLLESVPEEVSLQEGEGSRIDTDAVEDEDREALRGEVRGHFFLGIAEGTLRKRRFSYGVVQKYFTRERR